MINTVFESFGSYRSHHCMSLFQLKLNGRKWKAVDSCRE